MKIYTRTGDTGLTSLMGGKRVSKADAQVEVYGILDELNSSIGYFLSVYGEILSREYVSLILQIQRNIFKIGALYSFDFSTGQKYVSGFISDSEVDILEREVDAMQDKLISLRGFILPGGAPSAAYAHLLRCISRRSEREMVSFYEKMEGDANKELLSLTIRYMNRMSDFFFVLARFLNKEHHCDEPLV